MAHGVHLFDDSLELLTKLNDTLILLHLRHRNLNDVFLGQLASGLDSSYLALQVRDLLEDAGELVLRVHAGLAEHPAGLAPCQALLLCHLRRR